MDIWRENAINCLTSVSKFISEFSELCNAHTVDFIVKDRWCILNPELRNELLSLDLEELNKLFHRSGDDLQFKNCQNLFSFVKRARSNTLEAMSDKLPQYCAMPLNDKKPNLMNDNFLMTPKKSYEVEAMGCMITSLSEQYDINTVVDFGSGKGYLSTHLSLNHGMNSLGLDSSQTVCQAADARKNKLIYCLTSKRHKLMHNKMIEPIKKENTFLEGSFIGNQLNITKKTDLSTLIDRFAHGMSDYSPKTPPKVVRAIFAGLHTCGNLHPCMIKQFVSTPQAKVLSSVGCCYQHVLEEFVQDALQSEDKEYGFPMSEFLLRSKYKVGRNARMLASQSPERLSEKKNMHNKSLFYRALFQVILRDHIRNFESDYRVGKLGSKCKNFAEYVQKALSKLGLDHIQLSEQECSNYLERYAGYEKKIYAFQMLRILMSSCIEALMLLDRFVFLLEQKEIQEAYLYRLFDPVISPRCYALVALKK